MRDFGTGIIPKDREHIFKGGSKIKLGTN